MRAEKVAAVESLRGKLKEARFVIFVGFSGVVVPEVTSFRREVKKAAGAFKVIKNTAFQRALQGINLPEAKDMISGPTGIILFSGKDEAALVKTIFNFNKDKTVPLVFRGGYQDGAVISKAQLERISKLPGREAVLSQFVSGLASPIYQFLYTLKAVPQGFASVLKQISEKEKTD